MLFAALLCGLAPFNVAAGGLDDMEGSIDKMIKEVRAYYKDKNEPQLNVDFIVERYIPTKVREDELIKYLTANGFNAYDHSKEGSAKKMWILTRKVIPWWQILYGRVDLRVILTFQDGVLSDVESMVFLTAL